MEISVQSSELIEALSSRVASLVVELETTTIALRKAQEAISAMEQRGLHIPTAVNEGMLSQPNSSTTHFPS
jgi:energy-coupling factor transporter transmembrane protein EcfT